MYQVTRLRQRDAAAGEQLTRAEIRLSTVHINSKVQVSLTQLLERYRTENAR